jgi:hypothetical protein
MHVFSLVTSSDCNRPPVRQSPPTKTDSVRAVSRDNELGILAAARLASIVRDVKVIPKDAKCLSRIRIDVETLAYNDSSKLASPKKNSSSVVHTRSDTNSVSAINLTISRPSGLVRMRYAL